MKPFDLEAAKRGKPICTRDGRKAHFIGVAPDGVAAGQPVVVWIAGSSNPDYYSKNGSYYWSGGESALDLFMAPRKQVRYLIVWRDSDGDVIADLCSDEMECNHYVDRLRDQGHTVLTHGQKIEWEE